jgi:DNA invertase Pin-like site-specific DNA recombinase
MIKDAEEKKFEAILTTSFSRLSRNRKLLNKLSENCEINGIQIIILEEPRTDVR